MPGPAEVSIDPVADPNACSRANTTINGAIRAQVIGTLAIHFYNLTVNPPTDTIYNYPVNNLGITRWNVPQAWILASLQNGWTFVKAVWPATDPATAMIFVQFVN